MYKICFFNSQAPQKLWQWKDCGPVFEYFHLLWGQENSQLNSLFNFSFNLNTLLIHISILPQYEGIEKSLKTSIEIRLNLVIKKFFVSHKNDLISYNMNQQPLYFSNLDHLIRIYAYNTLVMLALSEVDCRQIRSRWGVICSAIFEAFSGYVVLYCWSK